MSRREAMAAGLVWTAAVSLLLSLVAAGPGFGQGPSTDEAIRFFQWKVSRDAQDFISYGKLGAAYVQKARETGDITYYELAEKALKRSLELGPDPSAAATTNLALVALARHQFREALAHAQKGLETIPGQLGPYAVVGDAYVELGEYEKAAHAYSRMFALPGPRYPHSRLSHLAFLRGDPAAAIEHMRQAVEAATEGNTPRENVAWSQVQLGELFFHVGDLPKAEAAHRDALGNYPGYHRAAAGLAKVAAARQRHEEAIELYRRALGVIPLPEYAAALGDVYTKAGRAHDARKQYDLVQYIGYLNSLNKAIYNRELALFYADHDLKLHDALELAERELEVRRDVYTYDVLAWALHKNGKPREALAALAEALKLGTKDARLYFHAGMIHRAAGAAERARDYLARALATNPHFHPLQAEVARQTLKELEARTRQP